MHKPMKFFTDHEILMSGYVCCRSSTSEVIMKKKSFVSMYLYIQMLLRIVYLGFDLLCPNRHHVVQANVPPRSSQLCYFLFWSRYFSCLRSKRHPTAPTHDKEVHYGVEMCCRYYVIRPKIAPEVCNDVALQSEKDGV